jgi:hypothetical protein
MVEDIENQVLEDIRALYQEDNVARSFFVWVAQINHDSAETSLDRIASKLSLRRSEAVTLAKQLEGTEAGRFIVGRKGGKSRVQWTYSLRSLGLAAKGDADELEELDPDIAAETAEQGATSIEEVGEAPMGDGVEHKYKLRLDTTVTFKLPGDLTKREAERLAAFIQSLPFET